jgi:16S rRNA (uracil1498-N3)-methyltransferase
MPRIFLPDPEIRDGIIFIRGEKARYLTAVLRSGAGDSLTVNDTIGNSYSAKIIRATRKEVLAEITGKEDSEGESPLKITLLQGLLKGEKMDLVVQKATELGVEKIIPVITCRSQVRETRKLGRWQKIAEEASRQSGRPMIPVVGNALDFEGLFDGPPVPGRGIIFWEKGGGKLPAVFEQLGGTRRIELFTGPEGGFSDEEIMTAKEKGFIAATMGRRILRAETAAIVALGIVQYQLGDLGS